jgi:hypothetical protein
MDTVMLVLAHQAQRKNYSLQSVCAQRVVSILVLSKDVLMAVQSPFA